MGDTTVFQNTSISIKNQSTDAVSYKWYLNNQYVSSAQDFTYPFSGVGAYTLKLVATNGTCNNEKLITVIVLQQCFQPAYQQILHSPHKEFIKQVYNLPDESMLVIGGVILAGRTDKDGLMMKFDRWGKVQWAKCYGGSLDDEFTKVGNLGDAGVIVAIGNTKSFGDPAGSAWAAGIDLFGQLNWSQAYYDNTPGGIVFNDLVKFGNSVGLVGTCHKNTADHDALFLQIYGFDGRAVEHTRFANSGADEGIAISILNDTFCIASGSKVGSINDIILTKINTAYQQPYQSKRIHVTDANLEPASIFYNAEGLLINAILTNTFDNNPKPVWINTASDLHVISATSVDHGVNAQNFAAHTSQNNKWWNGSNEGNKLNLSSITNNIAVGKSFSFTQPIALAGIALNTDSTISTASNIALNGNNDILLTKTTLQATNYGCSAADLTVKTIAVKVEVADEGWQSTSDFAINTAATTSLVTTDLTYTVETLCQAPECKSTGPVVCSPESFFKTYSDDYNRAGFGKLIIRKNDILTLGGVASGQGAGVTSLNFNGDINHINKYGNVGNNLSILNFMEDSDGSLVYIGYKSGGYNIMLLKTAPTGSINWANSVGSSRVDLQACKLEYSIVSPK